MPGKNDNIEDELPGGFDADDNEAFRAGGSDADEKPVDMNEPAGTSATEQNREEAPPPIPVYPRQAVKNNRRTGYVIAGSVLMLIGLFAIAVLVLKNFVFDDDEYYDQEIVVYEDERTAEEDDAFTVEDTLSGNEQASSLDGILGNEDTSSVTPPPVESSRKEPTASVSTSSRQPEKERRKEAVIKTAPSSVASVKSSEAKKETKKEPDKSVTQKQYKSPEAASSSLAKDNKNTAEEKKEGKETARKDMAVNSATDISGSSRKENSISGGYTSAGTYTVQIYSSPSKSDAESWLENLKRKKVTDAYISMQKIKDITYYRVRFGKYGNKEAARSEAIRLGYSQAWVDKIK